LGKPCLNICSIYIMIYHELCHVHYLGEASGGVHGDNRLAGNSLLECLLAERGGGWCSHLLVDPIDDFSMLKVTMALWFSRALMCSVDKHEKEGYFTPIAAWQWGSLELTC
jgi:hypothetical protein